MRAVNKTNCSNRTENIIGSVPIQLPVLIFVIFKNWLVPDLFAATFTFRKRCCIHLSPLPLYLERKTHTVGTSVVQSN